MLKENMVLYNDKMLLRLERYKSGHYQAKVKGAYRAPGIIPDGDYTYIITKKLDLQVVKNAEDNPLINLEGAKCIGKLNFKSGEFMHWTVDSILKEDVLSVSRFLVHKQIRKATMKNFSATQYRVIGGSDLGREWLPIK